jgi:hypothetical protein
VISFGSFGIPDAAPGDTGFPFVLDFVVADFFFVSVGTLSSRTSPTRRTSGAAEDYLIEREFEDYAEERLRGAVQVGPVLRRLVVGGDRIVAFKFHFV